MITIKNTKLQYLLQGVNEEIKNNFITDKEGLYSITKYSQAEIITKLILKHCKINKKDSKILDACSCVGGNLLSFVKYFDKCYGFEIDKKRFEYLQNNLKYFNNVNLNNISSIYFIDEYIKKLNIDINNLKLKDLKNKNNKIFDVIFYDPPWGGEDYKEKKDLELFLDDINLKDIIKKSFLISNYVVLKVPKNYNFFNLNLYSLNLDIFPIISSKSSFYNLIIISINNLNFFFKQFYISFDNINIETNKNSNNNYGYIKFYKKNLKNNFNDIINDLFLNKNNIKLFII